MYIASSYIGSLPGQVFKYQLFDTCLGVPYNGYMINSLYFKQQPNKPKLSSFVMEAIVVLKFYSDNNRNFARNMALFYQNKLTRASEVYNTLVAHNHIFDEYLPIVNFRKRHWKNTYLYYSQSTFH